jgi:hypothetical protein
MLADCFTKCIELTQLMSALESGFLRHEIKQWIIRDVYIQFPGVPSNKERERRSVANEAFLGLTTISICQHVGDPVSIIRN